MARNFNENLDKYNQLLAQYNVNLRVTKEQFAEISKSASDFVKEVNESVKLQKEMKKSIGGLANALKEVSETQKTIKFLEKEREKVEKRILTATLEEKLALIKSSQELQSQIKTLKDKQQLLEKNYRMVNKTNVVLKEMGKVLGAMPKAISTGFNRLKGTGIFEMDKAIKKSALSMGLLGSRSEEFYGNIQSAQDAAINLGVTIQELAEMQAVYSDELGRSVLLGKEGLEAITNIAKGTGLGAEAAAKMAGEFDSQGLSAEKTAKFMEQTMNDASSMGLNASKVVKNIQGNIKLLNRYNFKGGVKGLAKMAETVTKLGMDMNSIAPMADKLFNIEGAVEMSAQLQVLGGRWSQLADPFKLMYQARNDMDGLVKSIGEAAAQSASLDEDGNIKLASVEMARLRQVAETTGISYDELAEAAKRAGKAAMIKSKLSMTGLDEEEQEFLANVAEFQDGRAFITLNGEKKFLDQLDVSTKSLIQSKMQEQKSLKERAQMAMSFDEQVDSIINQLKQYFLPLAKDLADPNKGLAKSLIDFKEWLVKERIGEKVASFSKVIASFASSVGSFVMKGVEILGPTGILATWGALKAATWIANGVALAKGFNTTARVSGGADLGDGGGRRGRGGFGGRRNMSFGKSLLKGAKGFGIGTIASLGMDAARLFTDEGSTTDKTLGTLGTAAGWAGTGALIGSVIPGIGNALGAGIGGVLGLGKGIYDNFVNDGVIFNPKDKFMKVNDGTMIAGTNVDGNKSLAKALMHTMVPAAQTSSIPSTLKLSDLNITGTIELRMNGSSSKEFGDELLGNPMFIRELSKMVNMAIASATSGTQPQKPKR